MGDQFAHIPSQLPPHAGDIQWPLPKSTHVKHTHAGWEAYENEGTQEEKETAGCSITNKVLLVPRPPWRTNCTEMDTPSYLLSLLFLLPLLFHSCIIFESSTRPSDGHILFPSLCPPLPLRWHRLNHKARPRTNAKTKEAAASPSVTQPSYSTTLYYSPRFL